MSILRTPSISVYRNPTLRPGLAALVELLMDRNYSGHMVGRIFDHVAVHGTVSGSGCLEAEDEADAEAAFVDALEPVPFDSEAWDDPDVYLDAESILEAAGKRRIPSDAVLVPPELDDDLDDGPTIVLAAAGVMPVAGGAPLPFEPSPEDWADYRAHVDRAEALYGYE